MQVCNKHLAGNHRDGVCYWALAALANVGSWGIVKIHQGLTPFSAACWVRILGKPIYLGFFQTLRRHNMLKAPLYFFNGWQKHAFLYKCKGVPWFKSIQVLVNGLSSCSIPSFTLQCLDWANKSEWIFQKYKNYLWKLYLALPF